MSHLDPIAYTYEADYHCPSCTEVRFGRCTGDHVYSGGVKVSADHWLGVRPQFRYRFVACTADHFGGFKAIDAEGNDVGALAPWSAWWHAGDECECLTCGTCGGVIDTVCAAACPGDCIASGATDAV